MNLNSLTDNNLVNKKNLDEFQFWNQHISNFLYKENSYLNVTSDIEEISKEVTIAPNKKDSAHNKQSFQLLNKWEGVVLEVLNDDTILVELTDKTNLDFPTEEAIISLSEINNNDLPLVEEGAVFYLSVGYIIYKSGSKKKSESIRFRRLINLSQSQINEAKARADEMFEFFNFD